MGNQWRSLDLAVPLFHQCLYLTGPTASGKSAVGVRLARILGAEILSMDSMTLYRGLDIGTAKPSLVDRQEIPHHLIDVLEPWEGSSVATYREMAEQATRQILERGRRPLFVGGSPLYLKALLRGLFEGPSSDPAIREALERLDNQSLHEQLERLDPVSAARLHPNDRRRLIRAIEVCETTGRPLSSLQTEHDQPAPAYVPVICLEHPRDVLHARINRRVDEMFKMGFVDEVRRIMSGPRPLHPVPAQAAGYKEVMEHLADPLRVPLSTTIERVKARTRQLAKRQVTWFRGLSEVRHVPVGDDEDVASLAERLARYFLPDQSS